MLFKVVLFIRSVQVTNIFTFYCDTPECVLCIYFFSVKESVNHKVAQFRHLVSLIHFIEILVLES